MTNRGVYPPLQGVPVSHWATGRFDAYDATVLTLSPDGLLDDLTGRFEAAGHQVRVDDTRKIRHYAKCRVAIDAKGSQLFVVKHGGANPHPHVESKGANAQLLSETLRDPYRGYRHRPTRIDYAIDRSGLTLFDDTFEWAKLFAKRIGLRTDVAGDWINPDMGRTLYLGGRTSQFMVRHYEKGLEYAQKTGLPLTDDLRAWNRFEIEFKPQKGRAKDLAASMTGEQIWGSSPWTAQYAQEVLSMATTPVSIRERRESDRERALRYMGRQYDTHAKAVFDECRGDLTEFGWRMALLFPSLAAQMDTQAA